MTKAYQFFDRDSLQGWATVEEVNKIIDRLREVYGEEVILTPRFTKGWWRIHFEEKPNGK